MEKGEKGRGLFSGHCGQYAAVSTVGPFSGHTAKAGAQYSRGAVARLQCRFGAGIGDTIRATIQGTIRPPSSWSEPGFTKPAPRCVGDRGTGRLCAEDRGFVPGKPSFVPPFDELLTF